MTLRLRELAALPDGLLELDATRVHELLGGPTLLHLAGRREPALFVTVLMHGNEPTGWDAVRELLRDYAPGGGGRPLPRSISLFVANTAAAAAGLRHLPGQPDYNRVWPGSEDGGTPEHALMAGVVERMAQRGVFASVDLHNNTGLNPHYACINAIETATLHLAALFGRTVVYFVRPRGVASMAMTALCPAVTLECGRPGQPQGREHARSYLDACLHLAEHPQHAVAPQDVDLYHTVATVKVPAGVGFGFGGSGVELELVDDLDLLNFRELPPGTLFGHHHGAADLPLAVRDEADRDVGARYFSVVDGEVRTRCAFMPSMLTRDERVIRQDCLCYLMERYDQHLVDAAVD